jgi:flagellin
MGLSVASNIASIRAQRQVNLTTQGLEKTFERLSSGLRINRASDDAAGLAIADNLRVQGKLASVAIRNANDGLSITSLANAAVTEINNDLSRMAELAQQSSNGVYTQTQRSALSSEFLALGSEIQRIASVTTFNGINLLSASSNITIQAGLDGTTNSQISIGSVLGTLQSLGLASSGSSALTYSITESTSTFAQASALLALNAVNAAINSLGVARGTLSAAEARLSTAVDYLAVVRENVNAAEGKIRNADIAQEVAEMVRLQVLQQSGTAILAQANQQPAVVLKLLS